MNFIKVIAEVQHQTVKLFIKEKDCYKAIEQIREIHMNGTRDSSLCVTIRKVRIDDKKVRRCSFKLKEIEAHSFGLLERLREHKLVA